MDGNQMMIPGQNIKVIHQNALSSLLARKPWNLGLWQNFQIFIKRAWKTKLTKSWTYTLLPTEKRWKHNDLRSRDTSRGSDDINIHAYEYSLDSRNCWKYANTLHIILHTSSVFCKNVWYIVLYFRRKSLILWDTPVPVRYDSQNVASLWLCTMYVWEREDEDTKCKKLHCTLNSWSIYFCVINYTCIFKLTRFKIHC